MSWKVKYINYPAQYAKLREEILEKIDREDRHVFLGKCLTDLVQMPEFWTAGRTPAGEERHHDHPVIQRPKRLLCQRRHRSNERLQRPIKLRRLRLGLRQHRSRRQRKCQYDEREQLSLHRFTPV